MWCLQRAMGVRPTEDDAVEIPLDLNNKEVLLDEIFEVSLSADVNKIASGKWIQKEYHLLP